MSNEKVRITKTKKRFSRLDEKLSACSKRNNCNISIWFYAYTDVCKHIIFQSYVSKNYRHITCVEFKPMTFANLEQMSYQLNH